MTNHYINTHETGCPIWPDCLTCPRAICILDEPRRRRFAVIRTDQAIATWLAHHQVPPGASEVAAIAADADVSIRTVYRYLARAREIR